MGPFAAELREFIRRLRLAEEDDRQFRRDLAALRQGIRDAWTEAGGRLTALTTITGTIYSGRLTAFPGATVQLIGHLTATDYGTATADGAGAFSIAFLANPGDGIVGVRVDTYTDHPTDGGRLDGSAVIVSDAAFTPGVTSSGIQVRASGFRGVDADTGYVFPTSGVGQLAPAAFPIATALDTVDSGNAGTFTATWNGSNWVGTHGGLTYTLHWNQGSDRFEVSITPGFLVVNNATTWTSPDPATSTKFSVSHTFVGIPGRTVTFQEP